MIDFDPKKFIDREIEYAQFKKLLGFDSKARLLAIQDEGGMGKTNLMAKLHHHCKVVAKPPYPVGLIQLDKLEMNAHTPFKVVKELVEALKLHPFKLSFPTFERQHEAYLKQDFTEINQLRVRGEVNLSGANLTNANHTVIVGSQLQAEQMTVHVSPTRFSPEQELVAEAACLEGFLTDIAELCQRKPLVILFDAYEKIPLDSPFYRWFMNNWLIPHCFDLANRPSYLLFVLAGRKKDYPKHWNFNQWDEEDCQAAICEVPSLGKWERVHVEAWLKAHEYVYEPHDVDSLYRAIHKGRSITQLETAATNFLEKKVL